MPVRRLVQEDTERMSTPHCDTRIGIRQRKTSGPPVVSVSMTILKIHAFSKHTLDSRFLNLFLSSVSSGAVMRLLFRF